MSYMASEQPKAIEEAAQRVAERDADVTAALEVVAEARAGIEAATSEDKILLADALDQGQPDPGHRLAVTAGKFDEVDEEREDGVFVEVKFVELPGPKDALRVTRVEIVLGAVKPIAAHRSCAIVNAE